MTERSSPPHLRLVVVTPEPGKYAPKPASPRGTQLAFPYPEGSTVVFVFVDAIDRDEFTRIVSDYTPRWIFDVRVVPRLDTIAASRRSAFSLFERMKVSYVDLFGRLGIKSYRSAESNPAFWSSAVFELLKDAERKGPYLFLFDNEKLLRAADEVLPDVITPVIGKAARFAHIGQSSVC